MDPTTAGQPPDDAPPGPVSTDRWHLWWGWAPAAVFVVGILVVAALVWGGDDEPPTGAPPGTSTSSTFTSTSAPDTTTTAPSSTSTSTVTTTVQPTPHLTWTGRGFAGLEWGADRATTIVALSDVFGPPSTDEPGECGQYALWRDPKVVVRFTDDGRFGEISFTLSDFPHASGIGVGDPIGALQAAESSGTWTISGTDGQVASTGQQWWQLRVDDPITDGQGVITLGHATGPAPDGLLELPVLQYSFPDQVPPCGD